MKWIATEATHINEWKLIINGREVTRVGQYDLPALKSYYPTLQAPNHELGIDPGRGFGTLPAAQRYVEERLRIFAGEVMK